MKHKLLEDANVSSSALKLREYVDKAIKDGFITHDEYDTIINLVSEDGHVDKHEQAILSQFQQMIHDKEIKFKMKK